MCFQERERGPVLICMLSHVLKICGTHKRHGISAPSDIWNIIILHLFVLYTKYTNILVLEVDLKRIGFFNIEMISGIEGNTSLVVFYQYDFCQSVSEGLLKCFSFSVMFAFCSMTVDILFNEQCLYYWPWPL